jgi:enoyl-CoA hydratase
LASKIPGSKAGDIELAYENYERLLIEWRGAVIVGTMNNPPMNQINEQMHEELNRFFQEANADPEARVIVLTGAGDRAFSAGGDLKYMSDDLATVRRPLWSDGLALEKAILQTILNLRKPFITRINGHAFGLGSTLAALADVSFMVEDAKIADTHVKVGLVAGDGGALIWPLLIGFAKARRYLLTGDPLTGREAADIGLITEAVPRSELDSRVYELADRLAAGAGIAINYTKIAINLLLRNMIDGLIEAHYGLEVQSAISDDHREAVHAFIEGRTPAFTGK